MFGHMPQARVKPLDHSWLSKLPVDGIIVSSLEASDSTDTANTVYRYVPFTNTDPSDFPRDAAYFAQNRNVDFHIIFDQHPDVARTYRVVAAIEESVPPGRR